MFISGQILTFNPISNYSEYLPNPVVESDKNLLKSEVKYLYDIYI